MTRKFTHAALAAGIVPHQVRWPEAGTSFPWQALHEAVNTLRRTAEGVDELADGVERDADLSEAGRLRRIADIGLQGIADVTGNPQAARARTSVANALESLSQRIMDAVKPPGSPAEVALYAEIRQHMRMQGGNPFEFFKKHAADERVASAVLSAPAFLSGLTDTEFNHLKNEAESRINPTARGTMNELSKALEHLEAGIKSAERMIATRCQLMKTKDGFAVPAMAA